MKAITEITGLFSNKRYSRYGYGEGFTSPSTQIGSTNSIQTNSPNLFITPNIEVDHCANLHGWQSQIVGLLQNPARYDLYVLSSPGSGKTLPITCYWINNILRINTNNLLTIITAPQSIPQILWLVPIKNLSANIEQETVELFTSIILQILNRTGSIVNKNFVFNNTIDIGSVIKALGQYGERQTVYILLGSSTTSGIIQNNQVDNTHIQEFKTLLGQLIEFFVRNALVGRKEEGINSIENHHTNSTKPFIISIYESSRGIIDNLDNLELIVFDEAQRIQGGREVDDRRAAQIGDSIHKVLFHNNGRKARIVMLSGSTNERTATNVMHYFNIAYKRNFNPGPYQPPKNITNPADIRVFPMANLDDKYTQLRIIQTALAGGNLRRGGIVYIVFGKNRINELIDKLAPSEQGFIHPGRNLPVTKGSLYSKQDIEPITNPGEINNIYDERLRRAASHGLGYLYRPEEMTSHAQHDTLIIQRLFKQGSIKVIFATDAVREGINITCKEIFIPTILLPPDNREMDAGSLAQLINRVGRKENTYATIYTDPKFIGDITKALSSDSKRFNDEPFILPGSTASKFEAGLNYGVNLSIQAAKELGKAFGII